MRFSGGRQCAACSSRVELLTRAGNTKLKSPAGGARGTSPSSHPSIGKRNSSSAAWLEGRSFGIEDNSDHPSRAVLFRAREARELRDDCKTDSPSGRRSGRRPRALFHEGELHRQPMIPFKSPALERAPACGVCFWRQ